MADMQDTESFLVNQPTGLVHRFWIVTEHIITAAVTITGEQRLLPDPRPCHIGKPVCWKRKNNSCR